MKRLFIYGSLQPGGPNEHILADVDGEWLPAVVMGRLVDKGWGASMGFPGLVIDAAGTAIEGYVLSAENLGDKWAELDAFEGEEYERVVTVARLRNGDEIETFVYALSG